MKIFPLIMTILMLAIGFVPCKDDKGMHEEETMTTVLTGQQHDEDGGHHDDGCSPFCVCACCSLQSVHVSFVHFVAASHVLVTEYELPRTAEVQELSRPIWQPPRLAA